ncbi:sensor histidine kinase [Nocardia sp. XZ_19_231]|uniref:sensor histidine kinase n=1 Tax=Nocardia sp. XZ_19_231 TaxID=2769252 RepID=UPI00351C6D2E
MGLPREHPSPLDALIAAMVTAATVVPALAVAAPWWIVGLSVLASVPVLWRRRAPVGVLFVVGPAITALGCVHALPILPFGTVVCVYTIAAYCSARQRRTTFVLVVVGILVSLLVPRETADSYAYAAMSFMTAWALGSGVRAKQAQIDALAERTRRLDDEREAAVVRERLRIARDMHDGLAHTVGAMIVRAETGPLLDRAAADAAFAAIADGGRAALRELRQSIGALREDDPPHQPGVAAIADLVALAEHRGLAAHFTEHGARVPISPQADAAAYRIVQEALTNTGKHAKATRVDVALSWSSGRLGVRIADDGTAVEADRVGDGDPTGFGLVGMRERVHACGGVLRVEPTRSGFVVSADLPLAQGS